MKKTYEPETKSAIEQVIDVFNDYIRTSTHFELLWSDKVGYIYISIDNVQGSIGDTGCCVVNCGEELFDIEQQELMKRLAIGADTTETVIPSALYERLLRTAAFYPKRLDEVEKIMERVSPELVDDSFRMLIRTFREAVKRR